MPTSQCMDQTWMRIVSSFCSLGRCDIHGLISLSVLLVVERFQSSPQHSFYFLNPSLCPTINTLFLHRNLKLEDVPHALLASKGAARASRLVGTLPFWLRYLP